MSESSAEFEHPPSMRERVAVLAIIAVWLTVPMVTNLLRAPEEACSLCVVAQAHHHLAFFGYFMLGGYLLSFTQPRYDDTQLNLNRPHTRPFLAYRESVQGYTFFLSLVLAVSFFVGSVSWSLLW